MIHRTLPLYACILLFLYASPGFCQKSDNSLLWEISGKGIKKPSYLFGTHHLVKSGYLDKAPKVKSAFEKSQQVVVETEIDSSAFMKLGMMALMMDNALSRLMDSSAYALVSAELKNTTGYELGMFEQVKPVTVMLMLTMVYAQKATSELIPDEGTQLDQHFAISGKQSGKVVFSLETMEEQARLLYNHHSPQEQARQLVEFVQEKDRMVQMQQELTRMYLDQDIKAMWQLNVDLGDKWGDNTHLIDNRNKRWIEQLPAIMKKNPTFIAVGALHLPGDNGLVNLLRQAGYTVKAVK